MKNVTEHVRLHGNSILIVLTTTVSPLIIQSLSRLNLRTEIAKGNSTFQELFAELGKSDKIIAKVSNKVESEFGNDLIGQAAIFNSYSSPVSFINTNDDFDLERVIEDFKHDQKGIANVSMLPKYKINAYYIYESQYLIATQPQVDKVVEPTKSVIIQ